MKAEIRLKIAAASAATEPRPKKKRGKREQIIAPHERKAFEVSCKLYRELRESLANGMIIFNHASRGKFGNDACSLLDWCIQFDKTVARRFEKPIVVEKFFDWLWQDSAKDGDGWAAQLGAAFAAELYPLGRYLRPSGAYNESRRKIAQALNSLPKRKKKFPIVRLTEERGVRHFDDEGAPLLRVFEVEEPDALLEDRGYTSYEEQSEREIREADCDLDELQDPDLDAAFERQNQEVEVETELEGV